MNEINSFTSQIISNQIRSASNTGCSRHRNITSGLFVRARLPNNCLHAALRGENTWAAPFPLRINLWPRKRGGDCLCSRPPRGLAETFLRFAPIVCPRGMSAANFRPHLKACSGEKTISAFLLLFFLARRAPSGVFTVKLHIKRHLNA